MTLSIGVAFAYRASGDPDRETAARHVIAYYEPHADCIAVGDPPGELFSRAAAFNQGMRWLAGEGVDAVVCSNTDTLVPWQQIEAAAMLAVAHGTTVFPFTRYRELTQECSAAWLGGDGECVDTVLEMDETCVGPLFCCTPARYLEAGGCDERFVGWGFEDIAWVATSDTLLGPHHRVRGWATHFHHTPDEHSHAHVDSPIYQANRALAGRYLDAKWDAAMIRVLINERSEEQS